MGETGRTCRPTNRRGAFEEEHFTVKVAPDEVTIELRGRLVKTLAGSAADELRRAVEAGEEAAVQRLAARQTRNFRRRV